MTTATVVELVTGITPLVGVPILAWFDPAGIAESYKARTESVEEN